MHIIAFYINHTNKSYHPNVAVGNSLILLGSQGPVYRENLVACLRMRVIFLPAWRMCIMSELTLSVHVIPMTKEVTTEVFFSTFDPSHDALHENIFPTRLLDSAFFYLYVHVTASFTVFSKRVSKFELANRLQPIPFHKAQCRACFSDTPSSLA